MPGSIRVQKKILEAMLAHARVDESRECCGLLAGKKETISKIFSGGNVAAQPATTYEIAPSELFDFMKQMRAAQLDFLGIYHSHPTTENEPSPTDVARAYYPNVAYFILSPRAGAVKPVRAFTIANGAVTELKIDVVD